MGKILFSQKLHDVLQPLGDQYSDTFDAVYDLADATCVTDHDTDACDILNNGFELAVKARGREVWHATAENGTTFFFIGDDESEVVTRVSAVIAEAETTEGEDEHG